MVELDNEHLALLDFNLDNLARSHAEEEGRRVENGYIAKFVVAVYPIGEYLRIEAVCADSLVSGRCFQLLELSTDILEINRRQHCARTLADSLATFEHDLLQLFREALVRSADAAFEEFYDRCREVQHIALSINVFLGEVVLHHEQCHIANNLGGRSNLNQITEHHGYAVIHILDFFPAVNQAESLSLLLEVGVLAAGHFVYVNLRVGEVFSSVGCLVVRTDSFPITGQLVHCINIEARLARMSAQCIVEAAAARLGGTAAHGAHSGVDDIYACVDSACIGVDSITAAFMRMQVDRYADGGFQAAYEAVCSLRLQQAGHILDGDNVGAGFFQLLRHVYIVFEVVFIASWVKNIAGVAQSCFGNLAGFTDSVDRKTHVIKTVQAVKNTENVDAIFSSQLDELFNNIVRVAGVANSVRTTQQHLEENVRSCFAELRQSLPRAFVKEAVGNVEGCTAPAFEGEESGQFACGVTHNAQHVSSTQTGCKQGLMSITEGGVSQQNLLLRHNPVSQAFSTTGVEDMLSAQSKNAVVRLRHVQRREVRLRLYADVGIAVNSDISNIVQQLVATVEGFRENEELRRGINKVSAVIAFDEVRVLQYVF